MRPRAHAHRPTCAYAHAHKHAHTHAHTPTRPHAHTPARCAPPQGQLTVYNYEGGPCYRCVYPKPLPAEASRACSDAGVLGPVPGVIGVLQATETLKVLSGFGDVLSRTLIM